MAAALVADSAADIRIRRDRIAQRTDRWGGFTGSPGIDSVADTGLRAAFGDRLSASPDVWIEGKIEIILAGIESKLKSTDDEVQVSSTGMGAALTGAAARVRADHGERP